MKHIDIKLHYVRDCFDSNINTLFSCPTSGILADIFTKGLVKQTFVKLRKEVGFVQLMNPQIKWEC